MSATVEVAAATVAWGGAAILLLAGGRRGQAAALVACGAGLGGSLAAAGLALPGIMIAVGGAVSGGLRLREGPAGWMLAPPGSTPRIILCVAAALASILGASLLGGPEQPVRVAALAVGVLAGARLLSSVPRAPTVAAVAAMALAIGTIGCLSASGSALATAVFSAAVAAGCGLLGKPDPEPVGATDGA